MYNIIQHCTSAGTYLIQNISSRPCNNLSKCQLDIEYNIVADSKLVTGALIILIHDNGETHYRRQDSGARDNVVSVSGLTKGHYSLLVLLLNESGLPFPQPASGVINVPPVTADGKYLDGRAIVMTMYL